MKDWKVQYVDLSIQFKNLEKELTEVFKRVMSGADFILRDDVEKFEENIASYLGVKHVIGVNSGTDALFLALRAAGIGENDEVITVAHTFVASLASIVHNRAKPILVDIKEDFNIDVDKIEEAITKRTRAIMPVHLNGRACNMDKLMQIAEKHNLLIIEDAAQALGSAYRGRKVGSFGIAGCFSAHPIKTLSCAGDGGFISTNNDEIAEKCRLLRDHGQKTKRDYVCFGYNSRLDNLQAAILNVKFKYLEDWIKKRREIAKIYSEKLADLPLILPPAPSDGDYFD
ncbi:MAG: DegT/DnrJ/EryC1/StrS family aminotransferase, partial [Nanoarchaeota archaeon]